MRSLGERLNLLRELINLRCGPGAAILPPEVTRIHMDFALKFNGGHMGPRKFWRECLPRLKFHNPAIPMIINRHDQNQNRPVMTIYMRDNAKPLSDDAAPPQAIQPPSSRTNLSKALPAGPDERIVQIDMTKRMSTEILQFFIAETRAQALPTTKEDIAELQAIEAHKKQAAVDREQMRQLRAEMKKEQEMLKRARAAGGMGEEEDA
ncbi:mitochondrial ribosomal protein [Hirsutella rhossiliensis]|uniref:Mitochondrial ribosomal protein n=1 Tax=Hirsutella rhossiliensis TaxID=111463 RepID=A0A9P8SM73_9HYPO|nr:mitochondrial ribosomal protein [Hirsutella rhossiliensis]KAH0967039.1 mitochondrial ribosomal protein [Hirsutella rhossiliensis]